MNDKHFIEIKKEKKKIPHWNTFCYFAPDFFVSVSSSSIELQIYWVIRIFMCFVVCGKRSKCVCHRSVDWTKVKERKKKKKFKIDWIKTTLPWLNPVDTSKVNHYIVVRGVQEFSKFLVLRLSQKSLAEIMIFISLTLKWSTQYSNWIKIN